MGNSWGDGGYADRQQTAATEDTPTHPIPIETLARGCVGPFLCVHSRRLDRRPEGVKKCATLRPMSVNSLSPPGVVEPAQDQALLGELIDVLYADLRKLAHRERFRLGGGATLCTTALISEAWLKLQKTPGWTGQQHFLGTAALAMRHVLVNDVVARRTDKRNQGEVPLPLDEALETPDASDDQMLQVNDAVEKLARLSPRLAQVVECRYFAGFSDAETAQALGITARTVRRDWSKARAWLYSELGENAPPASLPCEGA